MHGLFYTILFFVVLAAVISQFAPLISKQIVDEIQTQLTNDNGDVNRLYMFIAVGFVATFVSTLLNSITQRLGDHFGGRIRKFLIERFYDHIFRLPQSYFDSEISGKIVNQLNRGINSVEEFMKTMSNFILPTFLQSFFTIGIMFYYSWQIGLFITLLFPIYTGLSFMSTAKWGKEEVKKNKIEDTNRGRIQEVIMNMKLVKGFMNQVNEFALVSSNQAEINKIYGRQSNTFHKFDFLRNLSLIVILLAVDLVAFYNTFQGNYSFGELVLLIQLVNQARYPLFGMSYILTQIQQTESGTKEFFEILDLPEVEQYDITTTLSSSGKGVDHKAALSNTSHTTNKHRDVNIEFKDVEFKYDTSDNILKNITLQIENNEKVALVGHSGAGKTTIINLIMKFYEPTEGEIKIGGKSYKELTHNEVRNNISLVFQENELFSTTVKENISYGSEATNEEVIEALKAANAWGFVSKFKDGINTEVGERGIRLSGGQKQRIQIARAILRNAPVVILDEATSNLDSKSEKEVQEALENLMKDRIVIIIAHRFSTIQNVDKIFVIDNGKIQDSGTPHELAKRDGIYKSLLEYQIEGDKKLLESFEIF